MHFVYPGVVRQIGALVSRSIYYRQEAPLDRLGERRLLPGFRDLLRELRLEREAELSDDYE
jgi:hypothetical protein